MEIKIVRDGKPVAKMRVNRLWDDHEISYVWVDPAYRGKGLASMLMKKAQDRFYSLVALVDPSGTGLDYWQICDWNKRMGFKPCKYRFHRTGRALNAWIWKQDQQLDGKNQ